MKTVHINIGPEILPLVISPFSRNLRNYLNVTFQTNLVGQSEPIFRPLRSPGLKPRFLSLRPITK